MVDVTDVAGVLAREIKKSGISNRQWISSSAQLFNDIVVVGPGGVSAEAFIAEGPHSVHGEYGRVTERVTSMLVATNREALVLANHILDEVPCRGEILQNYDSSSQWICRCPVGDN